MNINFPIADAHCDLLAYLQYKQPNATAHDAVVPCSIPHMKAGNVALQVLAIYTTTAANSATDGWQQATIFEQLIEKESEFVYAIRTADDLLSVGRNGKIALLPAIENASGFCNEAEKLEDGLGRLNQLIDKLGKILYISFTHHHQNRFGGGNTTQEVGLKDDGRKLLDFLSDKKIAVDFSHASDALAYGILEHIDKNNLPIKVIASHSNFKNIQQHPRNLTDELAQEIVRRGGFIGINWLKAYSGSDNTSIAKHAAYGFQKGWENAIVSGSDFFYFDAEKQANIFYFEGLENASRYPTLLEHLRPQINKIQEEKFAYKNLLAFLHQIF